MRFFARITASVTHELNNVIAVTNEVTGLLGDLIEDYNSVGMPPLDKLKRVHDRLLAQISRGQVIIKRLNNFAHTADESIKTFDLNTVMENLIGLSARLADLKKVKLKLLSNGETMPICGNPFLLQQAVYESIGMLLESGRAKETMFIETGIDGNLVRIFISGFSGDKEIFLQLGLSHIERLMMEMAGEIRFSGDGDSRSVALLFPI